jgi:hypothetical protein
MRLTLLVNLKGARGVLRKRFQYLSGTGTGSAYEADCIEEELEFCAEAEELGEWDWGKLWRGLNGSGSGRGIILLPLFVVVVGFLEGEPLLLHFLETLLLIRRRG